MRRVIVARWPTHLWAIIYFTHLWAGACYRKAIRPRATANGDRDFVALAIRVQISGELHAVVHLYQAARAVEHQHAIGQPRRQVPNGVDPPVELKVQALSRRRAL